MTTPTEVRRLGSMAVSLMQLGPVMFGGVDGIIDSLRHNGLLACNLDYNFYYGQQVVLLAYIEKILRCSVPMQDRPRSDVSDGRCWRCPQCKGRKSIREGSFFAKFRLPPKKWLYSTPPLLGEGVPCNYCHTGC